MKINNKQIVNYSIPKPCIKLRYCPYGELIEQFPFSKNHDKGEYSSQSCATKNGAIIQFGHDCPVHYLAEFTTK